MILVDKDIKKRHAEIFVNDTYNEKYVNAVSYDLHISDIVIQDDLTQTYALRPNEVVFVKIIEKVKIPNDLMGRIGEKNSRLRQGLWVSGPHYFPGHETYIYLRVQNITANTITIKKGDGIAQIFFETLSDEPDKPYDKQDGASFNNEDAYRGMSKYQDEYENRINKLNSIGESLDEKVNHIYANMLTLMGIFVSVFSLIMVNFSQLPEQIKNTKYIAAVNLSLGIVISLFMGLILLFINHKSCNKRLLIAYVLLILILIGILIFVLL